MLRYQSTLGGRYETLGVSTGTSLGTTLTGGGGANTMGSWASLGTTTFDYHFLYLHINDTSAAADFMVDVGIDDGASHQFVIINNYHVLGQFVGCGAACAPFPLYVPSGALLYARCMNGNGSGGTLKASVTGCSHGLPESGFSRSVPLFAQASTKGIALDPGGTINTKPGSFTALTTGVTQRIGALLLTPGGNGVQSRTVIYGYLIDVGIGTGGSEATLLSNIPVVMDANTDYPPQQVLGPFPCDIPPSTRISARCQCSQNTTTVRVMDLGIHGLVP